jgi:hypothetical protein
VCKIFPPHWMWTLRRNIYALMASALCTCNHAVEKAWEGAHIFLYPGYLLDQDAPFFHVQVGLAAFLTCWCVSGVFLVWPCLRQQGVSAAPICDSAPSGCTIVLMRKWPLGISDKLLSFLCLSGRTCINRM